MKRTASVSAPAKVNLFLRVLHRRADGFHELETLFQAISTGDEVRVTLGARIGTPPGIELRVDGPDLGPPESNLAYRAALAFRELSGRCDDVRIDLVKNIPVGAGLGGGSSDAAAVLKCLAALTGYDDVDALHATATDLGSDVPFFLATSTLALGRGRGEDLEELVPLPEASLVLALPTIHVATGAAYSELATHRAEAEGAPEPTEGRLVRPPGSWDEVVAVAHNDFEAVMAASHHEIQASLDGLRERGARFALLSGSGAASFGLFADAHHARGAAAWLEGRHRFSFVPVTTLSAMPAPILETEG
ncbi:MAG: 4-(cytidine 5'-diphospho)-2-C-methyl-D-erythritol kinase [Gemmatimonadetes bacterium]|nr:4-(cytidine 5'-diphospho)-2-C-methyl-D-erythritol kinase [Gemmatimonadota bacterium]